MKPYYEHAGTLRRSEKAVLFVAALRRLGRVVKGLAIEELRENNRKAGRKGGRQPRKR